MAGIHRHWTTVTLNVRLFYCYHDHKVQIYFIDPHLLFSRNSNLINNDRDHPIQLLPGHWLHIAWPRWMLENRKQPFGESTPKCWHETQPSITGTGVLVSKINSLVLGKYTFGLGYSLWMTSTVFPHRQQYFHIARMLFLIKSILVRRWPGAVRQQYITCNKVHRNHPHII